MPWYNSLFSPPKLSRQSELKIKRSRSQMSYKTSTYVGICLIRCPIHEISRLLFYGFSQDLKLVDSTVANGRRLVVRSCYRVVGSRAITVKI
jgi:hypothetical protein